MKTTVPRLLAPCDLARLWSCSTRQILTLCREGKLPHIKLNSRVLRIPEIDAAAFYAAQLAATRPKA